MSGLAGLNGDTCGTFLELIYSSSSKSFVLRNIINVEKNLLKTNASVLAVFFYFGKTFFVFDIHHFGNCRTLYAV